jgi:hypothetical protein
VGVGVMWVVLVVLLCLVCVCVFAWMGISDCPMGLVGEFPDEAGYVCILLSSKDVF